MEAQQSSAPSVPSQHSIYYTSVLSQLRHSPPSLIFSDYSEDDSTASTQDSMAPQTETNHVSDVMATALSHLSRVVEHCRDQGQNEAANRIARDVHSILDTFNETTAVWDVDNFFMKPPVAEDARSGPSVRTILLNPPSRTPTSSWAAIAATDIAGNNRIIKFRPSDSLKRTVTEDESKAGGADHRAVWVYGWTKDKTLNTITERISTGAIFSMVYVEDLRAVCIIFQHANSAMLLIEEDAYAKNITGAGIFGKDCRLKIGIAFPECEDLKRMQAPFNERRRLTFARQQLFTNGINAQRFKNDLIELVGVSNLELVWLFNTGNATAVFSASPIARIVRDEFMHRSRRPGPYSNVTVSFSHDPCERPLNLVTQIPYVEYRERSDSDRSNRSDATKANVGGRTGNPGIGKFISGAGRPKKPADSDGWQTVSRKR